MISNYQSWDINLVIPTPDNSRHIDPNSPKIMEMIVSMREVGQLQAGVGRPHPTREGYIDLRAGACRYTAAKLAGLKTFDVNVLQLTDAEAMRVTVLENLQRSDLKPLEEARGIANLVKVGATIESIANDCGKSTGWVRRRMQLLELTPWWQKAAEKYQLIPRVLELIARYPRETQDDLQQEFHADWQMAELSRGQSGVHVLQRHLSRLKLDLKAAPWRLDDDALVPKCGACSVCKKRSDVNPELFEDLEGGPKAGKPGSECLDPKCHALKLAAHMAREEARLRQEHKNLIRVTTEWKSKEKNIVGANDWTRSRKGAPGARPAFCTVGAEAGRLIYVQLSKDANQSAAKAARKAADPGKPVTSLKERRAMLEMRRMALAIDHLRHAIDKASPPPSWGAEKMLLVLSVFGTDGRRDEHDNATWKKFETLRKSSAPWAQLRDHAFEQVLPVLNRRLIMYQVGHAKDRWPEAKAIAALLELDLEKLLQDAVEEIPEPKAWQREAGEG